MICTGISVRRPAAILEGGARQKQIDIEFFLTNKKEVVFSIIKKRRIAEMKKWRKLLIVIVAAFVVLGMFGIAGAAEKPIIIKVAVCQPMSGPAGPWGQIAVPAYDAWLELFNKEGFRVNGKLYNFQ